MQWERAKNITLLCFLLLNIMLGVMNLTTLNRYTLTQEQQRAIYQVLNQNKISMYSKLISSYAPMRTLLVSGFAYDMEALLPVFFANPEAVSFLLDDGREIYTDGIARLAVSNGYITYDNPDGFHLTTDDEGFGEGFGEGRNEGFGGGFGEGRNEGSGEGLSESFDDRIDYFANDGEKAVALCDAFIQQYFPHFRLDTNGVIPVEEGLRVCYREVYQQYMVYTNFIEFLVTENGIEQIDMQYGEIKRFDGRTTKEICAPDEALLTFVQHVRVIYGDTPVLIRELDLVYSQEEFSTQENSTLRAVPYYRIFVEQQEVPFMINAFTNTLR